MRLSQRLSHGVERLCQRLSRLSRRLWRRATHGEAAAGGHRDRTAGSWYSRRRIPRGTGTAASRQRTAQAASKGSAENVTPQGHKQRTQGNRYGGGIGISPNIKTPHRCVKMANRAYSRKAPGIRREQKKNPAQREPCGARLFLEFCKVKQQKHGLQQDIQQDQWRHLLPK